MNRLIVSRLRDGVSVSIENQEQAQHEMMKLLTFEEANRFAEQLKKAAQCKSATRA